MDGGQPFAFARLWEWWRGPKGSEEPPLESCSLITTDPIELARQIHDRMLVILDPADYDTWLDPSIEDRDELKQLIAPFPADRMSARLVSTLVNNARHRGPECMARA